MFNGSRITEAYEPDDDLQELLEDAIQNSDVEYLEKRQIPLTSEKSAQQIHYTVEFKNEAITGCTTVFPYALLASLQGNQQMSSALILALSLQYGEPTLTYEDHAEPLQKGPEYMDVTAEWYPQSAIEKGLHKGRMGSRMEIYDTNEVSLATLEERAERWLSSK
jgi:hypothetical protein